MKPLRVAFFAARDWLNPAAAGGDIGISGTARALAREGHAITYVCSRAPGQSSHQAVEGVNVVRLGNAVSQSMLAAWYYNRALRGRVDALVEEAIGGMYVPYLATLYVREPVVAYWHQRSGTLARHELRRAPMAGALIVEEVTKRAHMGNLNVTPSSDRREDLIRFGLPANRLHVLHPGIDDDDRRLAVQFANRPRTDPPELLFLGKLRRYKCADHLARAAAMIASRLDCRLIFAGRLGDGHALRELRSIVRGLGLDDRTQFIANVSDEQKFALLGRAAALVVPSPVEGFSLVALEAMACGTPVVASEGVPRDVVVEGVNGRRYPFGDLSALAGILEQLLSDRAEWERLSCGSLAHSKRFTWEASTRSLLDFIAEAR